MCCSSLVCVHLNSSPVKSVEVSVDRTCKYVTSSPPIMSKVLATGSKIGFDALNCNE